LRRASPATAILLSRSGLEALEPIEICIVASGDLLFAEGVLPAAGHRRIAELRVPHPVLEVHAWLSRLPARPSSGILGKEERLADGFKVVKDALANATARRLHGSPDGQLRVFRVEGRKLEKSTQEAIEIVCVRCIRVI
jgi:hypothetical protein